MQELLILSGLPGSGKSTHARRLSAQGVYVISPDTMRLALNGGVYPRENERNDYGNLEPLVWSLVELAMKQLLLAGHNTALDATNLTKARRQYWRHVGLSIRPGIRVRIAWFQGQWDSASRWSKERGHSEAEYLHIRQKLEASLELPTSDEADMVEFL